MKAIVNTAPGRLELLDWPTPAPGPGQVRIRTTACGICATDLEMIKGWARTSFPAIPGHEWAGVVDEVGHGVSRAMVGKPCVAENVLADGGEVGFEHPGGYGQYLVTEARKLQLLPARFPPATATLIEPLAVCVRAVRKLPPASRPGATSPGSGGQRSARRTEHPILVLGDGPIGLIMVMLLKRDGASRVCVVGGRPHRLALARSLGAEATLNYHDADGEGTSALAESCRAFARRRPSVIAARRQAAALHWRMRKDGGYSCRSVDGHDAGANLTKAIKKTLHDAFPAVVEASGSAAAMAAALDVVARGGRILVIGDYGRAKAAFAWNTLLHREITLVGSNASAGAWPAAVRIATDKGFPLGRLVSRQFPAKRFAEAFELVRNSRDVVKVVLRWDRS